VLARLGADALGGTLARVRDDARVRGVGPEDIVLPPGGAEDAPAEIWLDWAFVDFWKSNYCACSGHRPGAALMYAQIRCRWGSRRIQTRRRHPRRLRVRAPPLRTLGCPVLTYV
jgi:hypothetical protein